MTVDGCRAIEGGGGVRRMEQRAHEFQGCLRFGSHLEVQGGVKFEAFFGAGFEVRYGAEFGIEGCYSYTFTEGWEAWLELRPKLIRRAELWRRDRTGQIAYDWKVVRSPGITYTIIEEGCAETPQDYFDILEALSAYAPVTCGEGTEYDSPRTISEFEVKYVDERCPGDDDALTLQELLDLFESLHGYPFAHCLLADCGQGGSSPVIPDFWIATEQEALTLYSQSPNRYMVIQPGSSSPFDGAAVNCDLPECLAFYSLMRASLVYEPGWELENTGEGWLVVDLQPVQGVSP